LLFKTERKNENIPLKINKAKKSPKKEKYINIFPMNTKEDLIAEAIKEMPLN